MIGWMIAFSKFSYKTNNLKNVRIKLHFKKKKKTYLNLQKINLPIIKVTINLIQGFHFFFFLLYKRIEQWNGSDS